MRISDWSSDVCSSDLAVSSQEVSMPSTGRLDRSDVAGIRALYWSVCAARVRKLESPPLVGLAAFFTQNFRERSEEHTSELQSLMRISYAVFCLKKKNNFIYIDYYYNTKLMHNT